SMQSELGKAFDQLRLSRDQLEVQVASRTRELRSELLERQKAEDSLWKSQQRLWLHVRQSPLGVIEWDLHFRVVEWNLAAERIFGYSREEALGCHAAGLIIPPDAREHVDEIWAALLGNKGGSRSTNENVTKDGTTINCEWYNAPLVDDTGEVIAVTSLIQDVTEQMAAELRQANLKEQLERAERMESLAVLAGGVAHDLNNMLGPMVAYPEMILEELPEDSSIREDVEAIDRAAQQSADVIQDLLTLARRGRYEMVPTSLNQLIMNYRQSPNFRSLKSKYPDTETVFELSPDIPMISGSEAHLAKVVMNIVVNAHEAMPDGGQLRIKTDVAYIETLPSGFANVIPGDYIAWSIKDNGTGIDLEDLEKIFEPYYSKKKMGRSGSGLGLSVVYGIVKDHGGYYDIFSEVDKGTEFVFYLPVITDAVDKDSDAKSIATGTESILVVDDDSGQRKIATRLLSSLGYCVTVTEHGHAAVEYLRENKADIVMLDMIMEEGFDGLDTFSEIIKLHADQKVIIVSGFSATDRVEKMQQLGAGGYVRKPYDREKIGLAVREELDRKRPVTASVSI
ncbi:MAG: response regulator, partial [candidate division Zixibacteria bacterium]